MTEAVRRAVADDEGGKGTSSLATAIAETAAIAAIGAIGASVPRGPLPMRRPRQRHRRRTRPRPRRNNRKSERRETRKDTCGARTGSRSTPRWPNAATFATRPAGIPALDCVLRHASVQPEAGGERKVECELTAVAFGEPAIALAKIATGTELRCKGFLARRYRTGITLALHVNEFESRLGKETDMPRPMGRVNGKARRMARSASAAMRCSSARSSAASPRKASRKSTTRTSTS